jgi:hypothetical protein
MIQFDAFADHIDAKWSKLSGIASYSVLKYSRL